MRSIRVDFRSWIIRIVTLKTVPGHKREEYNQFCDITIACHYSIKLFKLMSLSYTRPKMYCNNTQNHKQNSVDVLFELYINSLASLCIAVLYYYLSGNKIKISSRIP